MHISNNGEKYHHYLCDDSDHESCLLIFLRCIIALFGIAILLAPYPHNHHTVTQIVQWKDAHY